MRKLKAIISMVCIIVLSFSAVFFLFYFSKEDENKKIVVTTFPIYDICRELLGEEKDILLLQDNGVDMHSYQATAKDISAISSAELFIFIGGESDHWVGDIIRSIDNVNLTRLCLMDHVDKLEESNDRIIEGSHEHGHDHEHDGEHTDDCYDEHIWLSIKNMMKMSEAILDKLINVYPHMETMLIDNYNEYISKLEDLDNRYSDVCKDKNTTIVMADRFPFLYLAHDYNINFLAAFHGCSTDSEASVNVISELIEKINAEQLEYVCVLESTYKNINDSVAKSVVSDSRCRSGVKIIKIDSCQSVSKDDLDSINYIDIMENNLVNIRKALNNEAN